MLVIYKTNINKRLSFYFEHKQLKQHEVDNIWPMEAGDQPRGLQFHISVKFEIFNHHGVIWGITPGKSLLEGGQICP